jgi:hypothetical protein
MSEELSSEDIKSDLSPKGIWQRLPQESPGSYAAFTTYLELGPDSTLEEVAEKTGRSARSVRHLSWRHHWMERAAAYRQHFSNTTLAAAQRERAKQAELSQMRDHIFRQQMWETSQSIMMACRRSLNKLLDDPKGRIAPYELTGLFNLGFRLGCRANEPGKFTSEGPAPACPDFEAAVDKVYGENMSMEQLMELLKEFPPPKSVAPDVSRVQPPQNTNETLAPASPATPGVPGLKSGNATSDSTSADTSTTH